MSDIINRILDFVLGNVGIVIFAVFLISGLFSRADKAKEAEQRTQPKPAASQDNRPLAERMAEYFGVDLSGDESPARETPAPAPQGRRSTTTRNVQQQYPELFGGPGMFASDSTSERTKWGFDETEWGSTFERNEEQWGNTFPDRKSSEPRIEWPS